MENRRNKSIGNGFIIYHKNKYFFFIFHSQSQVWSNKAKEFVKKIHHQRFQSNDQIQNNKTINDQFYPY
jgi:hypothetical protein